MSNTFEGRVRHIFDTFWDCFLSQQYMLGKSMMWDVVEDTFESLDDVGILEIATLT